MPDIPDDFKILNVGGLLSRISDERFHKALKLTVRVLIDFLQEHNLVTRQILEPADAMPLDLVIVRGDLSEDGFEFYKLAETKWMTAHDRGTAITDTSILVRQLKKLRASSS